MRETPDVETSSRAYARRFAGKVGAWFLAVQLRAVRKLLAPFGPGATLVDVGGGHGQLATPLAACGYEVTVLGSHPSCGELVTSGLGARVRFTVADLFELPFRDRSFDVALSIRSIAHLRDWPRFVGELCRVSRCAAIVDYPSARSANRFAGRFFDAKHRIEGDTREFAIFRPVEIVDVFAAAGFRVAETEPQFVLPMAVHRLHGSAVAGHLLEALAGAAGLTRRFGSPVLVRADRIPS